MIIAMFISNISIDNLSNICGDKQKYLEERYNTKYKFPMLKTGNQSINYLNQSTL